MDTVECTRDQSSGDLKMAEQNSSSVVDIKGKLKKKVKKDGKKEKSTKIQKDQNGATEGIGAIESEHNLTGSGDTSLTDHLRISESEVNVNGSGESPHSNSLINDNEFAQNGSGPGSGSGSESESKLLNVKANGDVFLQDVQSNLSDDVSSASSVVTSSTDHIKEHKSSRYARMSSDSEAFVEQSTYTNPDMERLLRRLAAPQPIKTTLKDLIPDWPVELHYIEKPEFKMPEVKEEEVILEAQVCLQELKKMDPVAIFKSDYWLAELEDQTCDEKTRAEFVCTYSNASARVRWYKNSQEIFHGHKYNFVNEDGNFRLILPKLAVDDRGKYTCQADDKETSANLTVIEKKIQYKFLVKLPEAVHVSEKGGYLLECSLSDPKPAVVWKKNNEKLEYTLDTYDLLRRENRCILRMRNIQAENDVVVYSCHVEGDVTSCHVTVDEPDYEFSRPLVDVDCFEKETAVFECEVNYAEAPTRWLKDDKPINIDGVKYKSVQESVRRQLQISNIVIKDDGVYSCRVQTKFTNAKLFVAADVVISEQLKDLKMIENEIAKLKFKVKNPKNYDIKWFKDDKPLQTIERYEISNKDGRNPTLSIQSLQLSDAGLYQCTIGDRATSCRLVVEPCLKPVKINPDSVPREIHVKAGKPIDVVIPYIGTPLPTLMWTKDGETLVKGDGVEWSQTPTSCVFRVTGASRRHVGEYSLHLANEGGTDNIQIAIMVTDRPRAPQGPLYVLDVFKNRCHLKWHAPQDDGGLDISYYLVESRDVEEQVWKDVGKFHGDTQCGVPDLVTGNNYEFRVRAVNTEGQSDYLYTQVYTLAKDPWDPPSQPDQPVVVDYDSHMVAIRWISSQSDGGNPIQKYIIEKRHEDSQWKVVGMVHPMSELCAVIADLEEFKVYQFRVCAVNEAGNGLMSEPSIGIKTEPTRVPPVIDRTSFSPAVKVKSGQQFTLEVQFTGRPAPKTLWQKNGKALLVIDGIDVKSSGQMSVLHCPTARRELHNATYRLTVINEFGCDIADIHVLVISEPSSPVGPLEVIAVRSTSVVIGWKIPTDDGGLPVTGYLVEKFCSTGSDWEKVPGGSVTSDLTEFKITRLTEKLSYLFRVRAENDFGLSEPLVTEKEIIAKNPFDCPGAPGSPLVTDSNINFISIAWTLPISNGGAAILGYHVERCDQNSSLWNRLTEQLLQVCEYKDETVKPNRAYTYRIVAGNEGGESQPSLPSSIFKARPLKEVPCIVEFKQATIGSSSNLNDYRDIVASGGKISQNVKGGGWKEVRRPEGINENVNPVIVRTGESVSIDLQINGSPTPTVTWLKNQKSVSQSDRVTILRDDEKAGLRIAASLRTDTGLYTTVVKNDMGEDTVENYVIVQDKPGPPSNVSVGQVFSDRCQLSWTCPEDDGDSPITNYIVELCEEGGSVWEKLPPTLNPCNQYTVKGLQKNVGYHLRVRAENVLGVGKPAELNKAVIAKDPYVKACNPSKPSVSGSDTDFIILKWSPPQKDGGSPILGYNILRMEPALSSRWIRLNSEPVQDCEFKDDKVEPRRCYEYKVTAVTAAGESECSQTSGGIKAKPLIEKPKIQFESAAPVTIFGVSGRQETASIREIKVKAGQPIVINVPITGSPTPTVCWKKNDQIISYSTRVDIRNTDDEAVLSILESKREDSGTYKILLSNTSGEDTADFNIVVIDRPAPVSDLHVTDIASDHCALTWTKPANNGGLDLTEFIVEKYEEGETRWTNAGSFTGNMANSAMCHIVKDLLPNRKYKFRVTAKNSCGASETIDTDKFFLTMNTILEPSFPDNNIELSLTEGDSMKHKIACKGTRPFDIRLKSADKQSSHRLKVVDYDESNILLHMKDILREDARRYTIEVSNASAIAKLDFKLIVRGVCSACNGPLVVSDVTKFRCRLRWRPPSDDGGCKILSFVIEKKERGKDYWTEAAPNVKGCEAEVQDLVPGTCYDFRVASLNSVGLGEWLSTDLPTEAKMSYGVPSVPFTPAVSATTRDSACLTWTKSSNTEHVTGYYVEKKCSESDMWVRVNPQAPPLVATTVWVSNLAEDKQYEFRLVAVNDAGEGNPSDPSETVIIKDTTAAVLPQFIVGLQPMEAAEDRNVRFEVQVTGRPEPSLSWFKGSNDLPTRSTAKYELNKNGEVHSLVIRQITPDDADEYIVKATNLVGTRISRADLVVTYAPRINVPLIYQQPTVYDKGQTITLKFGVQGCPRPTAVWSRTDSDGKLGDNCRIESSERHVTLIIENASRRSSGCYCLHAVNAIGETQADVKIIVNDVADPPNLLKVDTIGHDSASLSWQPPLNNGGSIVTQYIVEKIQPPDRSWTRCATTRFCTALVGQLNSAVYYQFRLFAENIYGLSKPSDPTPVVTTETNPDCRNNCYGINKEDTKSNGWTLKDYDKYYDDLWEKYKPSSVNIKTGNFLDYFDVAEELNSGLFGTVYRVKEKNSGRNFIANVIKTESTLEKTTVRNEIVFLNQLHDPRILQLYDAFEDKNKMILVMEYLSGGTLLDRCSQEETRTTEADVIYYIKQICESLLVMHDRNILHLNLNLGNILCKTSNSQEVKLVNFSLSARLNPGDPVLVSTAAADFIAPEVVNHESVGFYTDMWAVGVIAYALLGGVCPFSGTSETATLRNISSCVWKLDDESSANISTDAKDFISKLIVRNPQKRMSVYEALEHQWLSQDHVTTTKRISPSVYVKLRNKMQETYNWWPSVIPTIGMLANMSSLQKYKATEFKMFETGFDRREAMPRFIRKPENCSTSEGGSVTFKCQVLAVAPPVVTWSYKNSALTPSIKYMPKYSGRDYVLKINRVKPSDKGEYTVKAENTWGKVETTAFLNVADSSNKRLMRALSVDAASPRKGY